MTCEECRERFTDLVENCLPPEADAEVRAHLDSCRECRQMLVDFWAVVEAVRESPAVVPPPALRERVRLAVQEKAAELAQFGRLRRLRYSLAGVAAVAAVVVVVWAGMTYVGQEGETGIELPPRVVSPGEVEEAPVGEEALTEPAAEETAEAVPGAEEVPPQAAEEVVGPAEITGAGAVAPLSETRTVRGRAEKGEGAVTPLAERAPAKAEEAAKGRPRPSADGLTPVRRAPGGGWTWGRGGEEAEPAEGEPRSFAPPTAGARTYMVRPAGANSADIQVLPPTKRVVGEAAAATVVITPERDVRTATVAVAGSASLQVVGAEGGVIYRGALTGGQKTELSVRVRATKAGTHKLTVNVQSSDSTLRTRLVVPVHGFAEPVPPAKREIKLTFSNTPIRGALQKIAAASGMKVVISDEVDSQTVTKDFSAGVPAKAALVIVAEAGGYRVREDNGRYVVEKP